MHNFFSLSYVRSLYNIYFSRFGYNIVFSAVLDSPFALFISSCTTVCKYLFRVFRCSFMSFTFRTIYVICFHLFCFQLNRSCQSLNIKCKSIKCGLVHEPSTEQNLIQTFQRKKKTGSSIAKWLGCWTWKLGNLSSCFSNHQAWVAQSLISANQC